MIHLVFADYGEWQYSLALCGEMITSPEGENKTHKIENCTCKKCIEKYNKINKEQ